MRGTWLGLLTVAALSLLAMPALAQSVLAPGQKANQIQITIGNPSTVTTLTGVRVRQDNAPRTITIDSISPSTAILEPGRSETFTVVFSVRDDAKAGDAERVSLNLQADQAVSFEIPQPAFEVRIAAASPDQRATDIEARLAELRRLRDELDAAAASVSAEKDEAESARDLAATAAQDLSETTFDGAATQACADRVVSSNQLSAAATRVEQSEALVDQAVRGAEAIAPGCDTRASAERIHELLDRAHMLTVEIGAETERMKADRDALPFTGGDLERVDALLEIARNAATQAEAAAARAEPKLTLAAQTEDRLQAAKPMVDVAIADAKQAGHPEADTWQTVADAALASLPEPAAAFSAAGSAASQAAKERDRAETAAAEIRKALACSAGKDIDAFILRAEKAHTGALIHLGASDPLRTRAAECLARNPVPTPPPPTPAAPGIAITNLSISSPSGNAPIRGNPVGIAISFDTNFDGMVSIHCKRGSDGHDGGTILLLGVNPGTNQTDCLFPAMPLQGHPQNDTISVSIDDGDKAKDSRLGRFAWQEGDEFFGMTVVDAKTGAHSPYRVGGSLRITTQFGLDSFGTGKRTLRYFANDMPFATESLTEKAGASFNHNTVLKVTRELRGKVTLRAVLIHPDGSQREGKQVIRTIDVEDQIVGASVTTGQGSPANRVMATTRVFVPVQIELGEELEGTRTLELSSGRGRKLGRQTWTSKGGKTVSRAFMIDTTGMTPGRYTLKIKLTDPNGNRDRTVRRFVVTEPPLNPPTRRTGGLTDRVCTGETIQIALRDHGSADGDIVSLGIGGRIVAAGRNLNSCHPGACVVHSFQLAPGERTSLSVFAHNTGSAGPNTAELTTSGGCTPETQPWNLQTGESGAIWISRP